MYTRSELIAVKDQDEARKAHKRYYEQFVPFVGKSSLNSFFKMLGYKKAQIRSLLEIDRHLNNLPDGWMGRFDDFTRANAAAISAANKAINGQSVWSLSDGTCLIKAYLAEWAFSDLDVEAQENRCLFWSGEKVFFGDRKDDGAAIYLSAPTWDCGWYWSFGYLGNSREHYHLSSFANGRNINMFDAIKADYHPCKSLQEDRKLWVFCELAQTAYSLKNTAEVLGRGGSHYTDNPCKEIIKNQVEVERLNREVLPAIFAEISKLFQ